MDEEMEYAEMLEIPVSTVNVTKKKTRKSKKSTDLKEQVISKVNVASPANTNTVNSANEETPSQGGITAPNLCATYQTAQDNPSAAEFSENLVIVESSPIAIPRKKKQPFFSRVFGKTEDTWEDEFSQPQPKNLSQNAEDDSLPIYNYNLWKQSKESNSTAQEKRHSLIVAIEFAACFALCLGIFLTNVFLPSSAINTFFRSLNATEDPVDTRTYTDFSLSSILSEEDAELTLSEAGILSFTEAGCVYPAADGTVDSVTQNSDGTWTVKIAHSATFSEVISGLSYASCSQGSAVKANIPLGYSDGNAEVQVSMYDSGALLNCFYVTESGNLAWSEE